MALLFIDGFDHLRGVTQLPYKYNAQGSTSSTDLSPVTGRNGGYALKSLGSNAWVDKILPSSYETIIVGLAYRPSAIASGRILAFCDSASALQCTLALNGSGQLELRRGTTSGTLLATSSSGLTATAWSYIELKLKINDTTGSGICKINGVEAFNFTGDTKSSSLADTKTVRVGGGGSSAYAYIDDLYICDTSGTKNNDFLGDVRVDALVPDGAGNYAQFTPTGSANNWENVDEMPADADTSYNASGTTGHKDSFAFSNLSVLDATIYGVQTNILVRKDDAGERTIRPLIRSSSTNATGATQAVTDSYLDSHEIFETNPIASADWTESSINGTEFGYEVVS